MSSSFNECNFSEPNRPIAKHFYDRIDNIKSFIEDKERDNQRYQDILKHNEDQIDACRSEIKVLLAAIHELA